MNAINVLIKDTFLRELRSKTLKFAFLLSMGIMFLAIMTIYTIKDHMEPDTWASVVSGLGDGHPFKIFYYFVDLWNVFLGFVFGLGSIRSDLEFRIVGQILSFPVKRSQYLLSRIVGSFLIVIFYFLITLSIAFVSFSVLLKSPAAVSFHIGSSFLFSMLQVFCAVVVGALVGLFFKKMSGMILLLFSYLVILFSNSAFSGQEFSQLFTELGVLKVIGLVAYFLLPRIGDLGTISSSSYFGVYDTSFILITLGHTAIVILLLFSIMSFFFSRKEF